MKITLITPRFIKFLLTTLAMGNLVACETMRYKPYEKQYAVSHIKYMDQNQETSPEIQTLLMPKVTRIDPASKAKERPLGSLRFGKQQQGEENNDMVVDITKERSRYKAKTPLFYTSQDKTKSADFMISVERGRTVMAGFEFSLELDFNK